MMKVLWYNSDIQAYEFGTLDDFEKKRNLLKDAILPLERFKEKSDEALLEIAVALQKRKLSQL
ncbi:MAG: hypothetical protein AAF789_08990 [Bacteroidota bacterium]